MPTKDEVIRRLAEVSHATWMLQGIRDGERTFAGLFVADPRPPKNPMEVDEAEVSIAHEATVSRIQDEQLFYLMSRGLSETEASTMIVNGFIEPLVKELPMEYAVEMNRLIELQMEGSVG